VPVEHTERQELALCAVKNMLGYGRYDEPKGTWSDDASMILCTIEQLTEGYDLEKLGAIFCQWLFANKWTASGRVFDSGLTTFLALDSIQNDGKSARESGCGSEDDNGNGSLMRILPAALYFRNEKQPVFLQRIHEISAITHAHPRSLMGCGIYGLLVRELLAGDDKQQALRQAATAGLDFYGSQPAFKDEIKHYMRILSCQLPSLQRDEISSTGYIVHTLEAAIWCFMHHENTRDILLEAVNLGLDTDTTGTVAGGLAGLRHGLESIPDDWQQSLARRDEISQLVDRFGENVAGRS
jgi:ADP-ribosylglycohydrolase